MQNQWMVSDLDEARSRRLWPSYDYAGPWYVVCGKRERLCPNYATARAWANYLCRRLGGWSDHNVGIRKGCRHD